VGVDGREFSAAPNTRYRVLVPHVTAVRDIVEPFVQDLSDKVRESVSVSVLDGSDIVFVSRVAASRIMTLSLSAGVACRVLHVDGAGCCWRRCPSPSSDDNWGVDHWSRSLSSRSIAKAIF